MTLPLDFSTDADVFDGRQLVTVQFPDESEPVTASALKRPISLSELELSNGLYLPGDVRWHFSATDLAQVPVVGTLVTEADERTWSVIEAEGAVFGARYTCTARSVGGP